MMKLHGSIRTQTKWRTFIKNMRAILYSVALRFNSSKVKKSSKIVVSLLLFGLGKRALTRVGPIYQ